MSYWMVSTMLLPIIFIYMYSCTGLVDIDSKYCIWLGTACKGHK